MTANLARPLAASRMLAMSHPQNIIQMGEAGRFPIERPQTAKWHAVLGEEHALD